MSAAQKEEARGARIHVGDPRYFEIVEFLEDEATLLDSGDLMGWVALLTEDVVYRVPNRVTRERDDGLGFSERMFHADENGQTIRMKATRLALTPSAWAENPSSRTRRFLTNIRVHEGEQSGLYWVTSSILLIRNRYDDPHNDLVSARREDRIQKTHEGFRIAQRIVYLDQSTLQTPNLAVYL